MNYLVTNPFCPYCYGNDRTLEKELPDLNDDDIMLLPYTMTPDLQEFDDKLYDGYRKSFENEALPYLKKIEVPLPKFYKKENISPSRLVFITYYFLRDYNLGLQFYHEITKKFYQEDFNYSNVDNLSKLVEDLGVNKKEYLKALDNPVYEQEYEDNLEQVDEFDLESVPAYIIDDELLMGVRKGVEKIKANR